MNRRIVLDFVEAINRTDVDQIFSLMSDDHTFVDSLGNCVTGGNALREGWREYFRIFPDYKIEIEEVIENDSVIVIFGFAGGTYKNKIDGTNSNYWRIPAAWKAVTEGNKIKYWQVFADNSLPIAIINKNK